MIKRYACPYCGAMLAHSEVRGHIMSLCPKRPKKGPSK